ncbi:phage baseplate assembly protein V [Pandoraea sputorum]|uniref:phage baseplate assembly protein V n=1 Tax=Pandoraea sputorum TaxID=93222 RepID=UPI00124267BE|nr:phage baseplate assembly protein V [Pandoraea sputorum]VVE06517.1 phage baseplate assembly protein V [Pandoraea sputorum]
MSLEQLSKLARRILLMLGRGSVTLVDDTGAVQKIQARLNGAETIPDMPRFAEYGFTSNPPSGTQVVIGFKNGDRNDGIVIATSNGQFRLKGLASGEVAIHDNKGQSVYLTESGIVVNGGGLPIQIVNAPEVTADTPIFKCTGEILDNCNTNSRTMAGMREVANGHTHPIKGVQPGSATVATDPPSQQE